LRRKFFLRKILNITSNRACVAKLCNVEFLSSAEAPM